jgi:hypothetical protein
VLARLFNLEQDPSEKYNKVSEHPDVVQEINQVAEGHKNRLFQ